MFKMSHTLNLAHGQFMLIGAFCVYFFNVNLGLNYWVSVVAGLLMGGVIAAAIYRGIFHRLVGLPQFSIIIATFGLAIFLDGLLGLTVGRSPYIFRAPIEQRIIELPGGVPTTTLSVYIVVVTAVVFAVVGYILKATKIGVLAKATAENAGLSARRGVLIALVIGFAWAASLGAVTFAGLFLSHGANLHLGQATVALRGLAPALLGGMDSVGGVLVGALIVGFLEVSATLLFGGGATDAVAWAIIFAVLLIRPNGLFGSKAVVRV